MTRGRLALGLIAIGLAAVPLAASVDDRDGVSVDRRPVDEMTLLSGGGQLGGEQYWALDVGRRGADVCLSLGRGGGEGWSCGRAADFRSATLAPSMLFDDAPTIVLYGFASHAVARVSADFTTREPMLFTVRWLPQYEIGVFFAEMPHVDEIPLFTAYDRAGRALRTTRPGVSGGACDLPRRGAGASRLRRADRGCSPG